MGCLLLLEHKCYLMIVYVKDYKQELVSHPFKSPSDKIDKVKSCIFAVIFRCKSMCVTYVLISTEGGFRFLFIIVLDDYKKYSLVCGLIFDGDGLSFEGFCMVKNLQMFHDTWSCIILWLCCTCRCHMTQQLLKWGGYFVLVYLSVFLNWSEKKTNILISIIHIGPLWA